MCSAKYVNQSYMGIKGIPSSNPVTIAVLHIADWDTTFTISLSVYECPSELLLQHPKAGVWCELCMAHYHKEQRDGITEF